ncbi:hypothetical protein D9M72_583220 [compost metagenome]
MLDRITDRLGWQKIDIEIGWQGFVDTRHNAFRDDGICFKWQVGAMLFVSAKWQDDDHVTVLVAQVCHVSLILFHLKSKPNASELQPQAKLTHC